LDAVRAVIVAEHRNDHGRSNAVYVTVHAIETRGTRRRLEAFRDREIPGLYDRSISGFMREVDEDSPEKMYDYCRPA
jgi:hypothetical protein